MKTLTRFFQKFIGNEKGSVASEYALLISCIAAAIAGSVSLFGGALQQLFQNAGDSFPR